MTEPPDESKLTRTKRRWAEEGRFLSGHASTPVRNRLPPGQHVVHDWPVLDLGVQPAIPLERWFLRLFGAVSNAVTLDWAGFQALPQRDFRSDMHCVTTWSRYDNDWRGVATRDLMALVQPQAEARFAILHSHDGYTTNLPLDDFASTEALLATHWQEKPITREHGGPVRVIVPHLYLWKSAKWVQRIEFSPVDKPGYWEVRGYHERGEPWGEERYS